MIKNILESNIGDKIIFMKTYLKGEIIIHSLEDEKIAIHWENSSSQSTSYSEINKIPDWGLVFVYEDDQDLCLLNLKYGDKIVRLLFTDE
jgi:hypothetical protein